MSRTGRYAVIDVGSNSIRMEIAEGVGGELETLARQRVVTRLGAGLGRDGALESRAMARSIEVLQEMHSEAGSKNVDAIRVVATAAVREATNGSRFIEAVRSSAGIDVEVISAEREAGYVLRGVSSRYPVEGRRIAAIDIGGGSTEVIFANDGEVEHLATLPLGAVSLATRYEQSDAIDPGRHAEMIGELEAGLADCLPSPMLKIDEAFASGGTFTTLASVVQRRGTGREDVDGYHLEAGHVDALLQDLCSLDAEGRMGIDGIGTRRSEIIVAGVSLADAVIRALDVPAVTVHAGGLRLGILLEMSGA